MSNAPDTDPLLRAQFGRFHLSLSNEASKSVAQLPCLSYGEYDRCEQVPLDALHQLMDGMNGYVFKLPGWLNGTLHNERKANQRRSFIIWFDYNISKEFYRKTQRRSWIVPMLYEIELKAIGNTSMSFSQVLLDELTKTPIVTGSIGHSFVEYKAQRNQTQKAPLPGYFKEQYTRFCTEKKPSKMVLPDLPNEGTYAYEIKVMYTDTDHNRHVNICGYIRYCMDCGSKASMEGFYKSITGDMAQYNVKRHRISYVGEAFEGDMVVVKTWESLLNENGFQRPVIYFVILKYDRPIVRSSYTFHEHAHLAKL